MYYSQRKSRTPNNEQKKEWMPHGRGTVAAGKVRLVLMTKALPTTQQTHMGSSWDLNVGLQATLRLEAAIQQLNGTCGKGA